MALVQCPNCGRKISDKAYKCPGCGYELKESEKSNLVNGESDTINKNTKKIWVIIVLLCIILGLIVAFIFVVKKNNSNSQEKNNTPLTKTENVTSDTNDIEEKNTPNNLILDTQDEEGTSYVTSTDSSLPIDIHSNSDRYISDRVFVMAYNEMADFWSNTSIETESEATISKIIQEEIFNKDLLIMPSGSKLYFIDKEIEDDKMKIRCLYYVVSDEANQNVSLGEMCSVMSGITTETDFAVVTDNIQKVLAGETITAGGVEISDQTVDGFKCIVYRTIET